jgi:hypothetical protein
VTGEELAFHRLYSLRMDYMRTMYGHRLKKKYPGRMTLILNEKQYKLDKNMGWKGFALDGLEIHSTPGDHWTRYLHGDQLSKLLLSCLRRAQAQPPGRESSENGPAKKKHDPVWGRKITPAKGHK